jgi:putative ABC transport system permease protein
LFATERTREIGVRKSLGAKTTHCMAVFYGNLAYWSNYGFVGIILGILVGYLLQIF